MAIVSFKDESTQLFYETGKLGKGTGWASVAKVAGRKLDMLAFAIKLETLRVPPANRLEALKGDLEGFYSIRINSQWRLIFRWTEAGAADVYIDDYH
jgi:proteic killer suppression protein